MALFTCIAIITAALMFIFAAAESKVRHDRKRIKTWRFGRVE